MKKLFLAFIICIVTSFVASAQTKPLNKQQTLDYITKLYQANFTGERDAKWSIVVEGKIMVKKSNLGNGTYRTDLSVLSTDSLIVKSYGDVKKLYEVTEKNSNNSIFWAIDIESDALRLKKALEHLIELVKAEKSTDPFDD